MKCSCCSNKLNSGMVHKIDQATGRKFKSCPYCTAAQGGIHVLHPYPTAFGSTSARVTKKNPDGYQSYCSQCRKLEKGEGSHNYRNGRLCNSLT